MKAGKMDWLALALLIASIGSLQIVMEKGQSEDWFETRYITVLAFIAGIAGIIFIWRMLVKQDAIVNLRLFNNRSFATGTLFNFILGFGLYGTTLVIPIFCQGLLGFTAMQTGLIMLPGSLATAVMMPIVGILLKRNLVHPAVYAGIGLILFFLFSFNMSHLNTQVGEFDFFWPLIIRGLAMGLIFIPLTTISLANLKGKEIPQGTALSNMVRQLGGSIGIALITTFISTRTAMHYSNLNENVTLTDPNSQERIKMLSGAMVSKGYDTHAATQSAYSMISRIITQQATFLTYKDLFLYLGLFFLFLIPLLIMFRNKKKPEHVEELTEWALE
jgi:DHA2 family multidrug resistance protein